MELVDRYIQAVKLALPKAKQGEICKELRANIIDEIEALNGISNHSSSAVIDDTIIQVLKAHGDPQTVAQQYAPQYPLVASEDMLLYKKVIMYALTLLFVYALVMSGAHLIEQQSVNAIAYFFVAVGIFIDNVWILLIVVTLSFYYLGKSGTLANYRNYYLGHNKKGSQNNVWSPEMLPEIDAPIIARTDSISETSTALFALLMLWTPLWLSQEKADKLILSFAPDMAHWRIIFTFVLLFSLVCAIYRLFKKYWTKRSLGIYILEYIVYIAGLLYLSTKPPLFVVSNPQAIELTPIVNNILSFGLGFTALIFGIITVSLLNKWRKL